MTTNHDAKQREREELLPCPFCGAGTSEIVENGKVWTGMKYGEPSSVSVRHHCEPTPGQPSRMLERVGKDRASAIAAWNTRALLAEDAKPIDMVLREALECADKADELLASGAHHEAHAFVCTVVNRLREAIAQPTSTTERTESGNV